MVLALISIQGCAGKTEEKQLPVAQWQFIDADTMKPIEGAFVNFSWRGNPDASGMQTCKRGVLGRSDKNGWYRNTALDASWHEDPIPAFFVPGYESFDFKYGYPDKDHIAAFITQDETEIGLYPAFEKRWGELGYQYQGQKSNAYLQYHAWTKIMLAFGFHDRNMDYIENNSRRYFVKIRSAPNIAWAAFKFVGKVCSDPDSINDVDLKTVSETDYLRSYLSSKYFCDSAWDSLAPDRMWDISLWLIRLQWLVPEEKRSIINNVILKDYSKSAISRNLTPTERVEICRYAAQFLRKGDRFEN